MSSIERDALPLPPRRSVPPPPAPPPPSPPMTPWTTVVERPASPPPPVSRPRAAVLIPPLPRVAFEVIKERDGSPGLLPAPTPGPEPDPTPGPGLMSFLNCAATGAPRKSASSSFIASRPTPEALRRAAASRSPGAFAGSGLRASATGGFFGSGFATSGCGLAAASGSGFLTTAGGGASRSSSSLASRGGSSSSLLRSTFGTGSHGMIRLKRMQTSSTRLRMRRKCRSSSSETVHGSIPGR